MLPMAADPDPAPRPGLAAPPAGDGHPEPEAVTLVQPYHARKRYVCPGCHGAIEKGEGHLVVVPDRAPDLRRHWHRACWDREQRRRHGRAG